MFWSIFYNGLCLCTFFCNSKERAKAFHKTFKEIDKKESSLFEGFTTIQSKKTNTLVYDNRHKVLVLDSISIKKASKLRIVYLRITKQLSFTRKFKYL